MCQFYDIVISCYTVSITLCKQLPGNASPGLAGTEVDQLISYTASGDELKNRKDDERQRKTTKDGERQRKTVKKDENDINKQNNLDANAAETVH